jgi:nitroimidazol reductase NimA-like FMN-containing flavoprotein (pyridoxamine 5'-phosphate oxidase superfamily)
MLIRETTNEDNLSLLARIRLGRLACARGAQPWVRVGARESASNGGTVG